MAAISLAIIGFTPSSVGKTLSGQSIDELGNGVPAELFGAAGNGIANDTKALKRALSSAPVIANRTYCVMNLEITDSAPIQISGQGTVETTAIEQPAFHINAQGRHMKGGRIEGLRLRQPNSQRLGSGTANDHACLKVQGVHGFVARDLDMSGADIAASFTFGSANLSDRVNRAITCERFRATDVRGMGLELFGCQEGSFSDHHYVGTDGSGGRAMFHGVRFAAYAFAKNENLKVSLTAENFATGLSLQRYTTGAICYLTALNCTYGVHVHGADEGLSAAEISRRNHILVNAVDCDNILSDGSSDNRYTIRARSCKNGIRSLAGAKEGVGERNTYEGEIEDGLGRLVWISQQAVALDIILTGRSTEEATYGLLLEGSNGKGQVSVTKCKVGAYISGNGNDITIRARECGTGLIVTGNNNKIAVDSDRDIHISGNNNVITGRVAGTVENNGAQNDLHELLIFS